MTKSRKLATVFTAAITLTSLSAFAESRHRNATQRGGGSGRQQSNRSESGRTYQRRESSPSQSQRYDRSQSQRYDRSQPQRYDGRSTARPQNYGRQVEPSYNNRNDGYRNNGYRNDSYRNNNYRNEGRRSFTMEGRISRLEPYRDGYRVWLGGGRYPYFVPGIRFRLFPLRLGLSIRFGGYWDPLGYYDVYDVGPLGGSYNTSGDLRGVVESVDYRRGTLVLRDDVSGSFVTTVLRGNDPRLGDLRIGDYVDLTGEWSRNGVFNAYNVADVRDGRDDRDRRY